MVVVIAAGGGKCLCFDVDEVELLAEVHRARGTRTSIYTNESLQYSHAHTRLVACC